MGFQGLRGAVGTSHSTTDVSETCSLSMSAQHSFLQLLNHVVEADADGGCKAFRVRIGITKIQRRNAQRKHSEKQHCVEYVETRPWNPFTQSPIWSRDVLKPAQARRPEGSFVLPPAFVTPASGFETSACRH